MSTWGKSTPTPSQTTCPASIGGTTQKMQHCLCCRYTFPRTPCVSSTAILDCRSSFSLRFFVTRRPRSFQTCQEVKATRIAVERKSFGCGLESDIGREIRPLSVRCVATPCPNQRQIREIPGRCCPLLHKIHRPFVHPEKKKRQPMGDGADFYVQKLLLSSIKNLTAICSALLLITTTAVCCAVKNP